MAERKIEIGKVFSAKVSGTYVPVRIDKSLGHGRYEGVTMLDGKKIKIATAAVKGTGETLERWEARQRPREEAPPTAAPAATPDAATSTRSKRGRRATDTGSTATNTPADTDAAAIAAAAATGNIATGIVIPMPAKKKKVSGLDAAVIVLREAGTPLNCGDITQKMLETGLWRTAGKTPANTLYSAIIAEIAKKGAASRFRKTDRGLFALTDAATATAGKAGN